MKKIISYIVVSLMYLFLTYNNVIAFKVIVPMAGLGTRLLPITKACPKSMVALVDKPALHYIVDEALESAITDFYFIVNKDEQETINHYFSADQELDEILRKKNKSYFLEPLNKLISQAHFNYIVQPEPRGSGDAVLMGEPFIKPGEFFCVMFPDNIIESDELLMARLIAIAEQYNATVITVEKLPSQQALQYGIVTPKEFLNENLVEIVDIIEKPQSWDTEFCLAQIGRHVYSYDIFESLKSIEPAANGEIQLTDAVRHLLQRGKRVFAYVLQGKCYDTGNIPSFIEATISLALHNPLYKDLVASILNRYINMDN